MKLRTARFTITPPKQFEPFYLAGHAIRTQPAHGVLDDVVGTGFIFSDGNTQMVWISLELIGMDRSVSHEIVDEIARILGIPSQNIIIAFTHSHSAPKNYIKDIFEDKDCETTLSYMAWVKTQVLDAIHMMKHQEAVEVQCTARTTWIEGLYGNRNMLEETGDKSFIEIQFIDKAHHVVATFVNFCCHPTVLGPNNLKVSGDLTGAIRRLIEERDGSLCMVTLGAAGNMSSRLYRKGGDEAELKRVSQEILKQINLNPHWVWLKIDHIHIESYVLKQQYTLNLDEKKALLETVNQRLDHAKDFDTQKVYTSAQAFLRRQIQHFDEVFDFELDCRFVTLGDIGFFTMPCELFSQFGEKIKKNIKKPCSFLWGYTFYNAGYLYNIEEKGKSFESIISNIPEGTTEYVTQNICEYVSKQ